jgi:type I restriction enzyme R subunit
LKENEDKRLALYKAVETVVRAFASMAGDEAAAGFEPDDFGNLRAEISDYEAVRQEIKLASGDYIDLKMYEPAMRYLIDTYIKAEESVKLSAFDDVSFVQLLVDRGPGAVDALPEGIKKRPEAVAEVIDNNVRRLIIDEQPVNPKYYDKMSELLDALIKQRRSQSIDYGNYLEEIAELAKLVVDPGQATGYPPSVSSLGKRALYDLLDRDETLTLRLNDAVHSAAQDGWRNNIHKRKKVRIALSNAMGAEADEAQIDLVLELVSRQSEY